MQQQFVACSTFGGVFLQTAVQEVLELRGEPAFGEGGGVGVADAVQDGPVPALGVDRQASQGHCHHRQAEGPNIRGIRVFSREHACKQTSSSSNVNVELGQNYG